MCIATDFWKLRVSGAFQPVFTGVPINFNITKQDGYGSIILSDSSTLLQAFPSTAAGPSDDHTVLIGSAAAPMVKGVAAFSFAVKTTFFIELPVRSATLFAPTSLSIQGVDAQSGDTIGTGLIPVDMQQGVNVCPPGYILDLDRQGASTVIDAAVCTECKPGSYSFSSMANLPGSQTPACLSCPAGCECIAGGTDVQCKVGMWRPVSGIYMLVSCPAGYQLVNSTAGTSRGIFSSVLQQCRACLSGQYIIDPDTDICQDCPPGLIPREF